MRAMLKTEKANYHTHSFYCDGKAHFEEFIQKAIQLNYSEIGFSSHAPTVFEASWQMKKEKLFQYLEELEILKNKYLGIISIKSGLEVDYIESVSGPSYFREYNLDYIIGSVHYIMCDESCNSYFTIDASAEEFAKGVKMFGGDVAKIVKTYYSAIKKMIINDAPDIVGHIDLIKKFNRNNAFFDEAEQWYVSELEEVVAVLLSRPITVEINTRGYYKGLTEEFYPSDIFLRKIIKSKIPVIINTDAHHPDELNLGFSLALQKLENAKQG
jgi:histidinol-phosphatase (PHP family)